MKEESLPRNGQQEYLQGNGNVKTRFNESNVPPLSNDSEPNVPQWFILDSRTFVAKSALSRLRALWGALLAKIWWEGAQKHFKGPGPAP